MVPRLYSALRLFSGTSWLLFHQCYFQDGFLLFSANLKTLITPTCKKMLQRYYLKLLSEQFIKHLLCVYCRYQCKYCGKCDRKVLPRPHGRVVGHKNRFSHESEQCVCSKTCYKC